MYGINYLLIVWMLVMYKILFTNRIDNDLVRAGYI